jgi:hypothetical protein
MPNKRSQPVDSSDPSSPARRLASKRPRLEAAGLPGKSKNNSVLRSGVTSGDPLHKRSTLEDDGVPGLCGSFLSGVFTTRVPLFYVGRFPRLQLFVGDGFLLSPGVHFCVGRLSAHCYDFPNAETRPRQPL